MSQYTAAGCALSNQIVREPHVTSRIFFSIVCLRRSRQAAPFPAVASAPVTTAFFLISIAPVRNVCPGLDAYRTIFARIAIFSIFSNFQQRVPLGLRLRAPTLGSVNACQKIYDCGLGFFQERRDTKGALLDTRTHRAGIASQIRRAMPQSAKNFNGLHRHTPPDVSSRRIPSTYTGSPPLFRGRARSSCG